MRFLHVFTALFLGSFALFALVSEPAQGCDRRFHGGPVYYQPAPVYYYQPYYAPPQYYQPSYRPAYSPAQPTTIIRIGASDNFFEPGIVRVQPGTTVRWVNQGKHKHTITSNDGLWDSGDLAPGATYSVTFSRPGTYSYYCRHHKGMQGTLVVGDSSAGGSSGSPGH